MFEIKIPELTDFTLMERYKGLKPLVFDKATGQLQWIKGRSTAEELRNIAYAWEPEPLRNVEPEEVKAMEDYDFSCLHTWGSPGLFKPTIAEVLSQVDYERVTHDIISVECGVRMHLVAFCIIDFPKTVDDLRKDVWTSYFFDEGYHTSRIRLYYSYKEWHGFPEGA